MTVYYYRGVPIAAPLTIESNEPFFFSDTLNLSQARVSQAAQRWELSFNVMFKGEEGDYLASLLTARNNAEVMVMPQLNSSNRNTTANAVLSVDTPQGAEVTDISVTTSEDGTIIPAGSFVQFTNHDKIYAVTSTLTLSSSGSNILSIYPGLVAPIDVTVGVLHPGSDDKPMLAYYTTFETLKGVTYEDGILINPGLISIIEAL